MSQAVLQSNKHKLNVAIDIKIIASFITDLYTCTNEVICI